ncbi:hypothetical protein DFH09DRAFT_1320299 [Mycena vulgaris]|nr:hypothetical protein DFH09DRAFT_1320299 [Mycena vulgaris]
MAPIMPASSSRIEAICVQVFFHAAKFLVVVRSSAYFWLAKDSVQERESSPLFTFLAVSLMSTPEDLAGSGGGGEDEKVGEKDSGGEGEKGGEQHGGGEGDEDTVETGSEGHERRQGPKTTAKLKAPATDKKGKESVEETADETGTPVAKKSRKPEAPVAQRPSERDRSAKELPEPPPTLGPDGKHHTLDDTASIVPSPPPRWTPTRPVCQSTPCPRPHPQSRPPPATVSAIPNRSASPSHPCPTSTAITHEMEATRYPPCVRSSHPPSRLGASQLRLHEDPGLQPDAFGVAVDTTTAYGFAYNPPAFTGTNTQCLHAPVATNAQRAGAQVHYPHALPEVDAHAQPYSPHPIVAGTNAQHADHQPYCRTRMTTIRTPTRMIVRTWTARSVEAGSPDARVCGGV